MPTLCQCERCTDHRTSMPKLREQECASERALHRKPRVAVTHTYEFMAGWVPTCVDCLPVHVKYEEDMRRRVQAMPPLTDEQKTTLRALLGPYL